MGGELAADARLVAGMLRAQERGILSDVILSYQNNDAWTRILSYRYQNAQERFIITHYTIGGVGSGVAVMALRPWTPVIYDGLAAIQDARFADGEPLYLPQLSTSDEMLKATILSAPYFICVDGKKLAATWGVTPGGDYVLTAIEMTEDAVGESDYHINIAWEDAQKLIGYWR